MRKPKVIDISDQFVKKLKNSIKYCEDSCNGEWESFRKQAYEAYYSAPLGNELKGKSQAVTADVAEVIDSDREQILDIFLSNEDTVQITPKAGTSNAQANAIQCLVNYILNVDNNKYELFSDAIFDGNLYRLGVGKVVFEELTTTINHMAVGVSQIEIDALTEAEDVTKIEGISENEGETFDIDFQKVDRRKKISTVPVPVEDFIFDPNVSSLDDCDVLGEKRALSPSKFKELYGDYEENWLVSYDTTGQEKNARQEFTMEEYRAMERKVVEVYDVYFRFDDNDDGVDELYRVVCVLNGGCHILEKETVNQHPYITYTPIRMSHQIVGKSLAEEVMDIQAATTALERQMFDNLYAVNTPRILFNRNTVDIEDINTADPSAPIGVDDPRDVGVLQPPQGYLEAINTVRMMKLEERTRRTGYNPDAQQVDPNETNLSGRAISKILQVNQLKIKGRARNFAESFLRGAIERILDLAALNIPPQQLMLMANSNEPLALNATTWRDQYAINVRVGLGTAEKGQQVENLRALQGILQQVIEFQGGSLKTGLVDIHKYYNLIKQTMILSGVEGLDNYINDPSKLPPEQLEAILNPPQQEQQQDPTVQVAELQFQTAQLKAQNDQQRLQFDIQKFQIDSQRDTQVEDREFQFKLQESQQDYNLKLIELEVEKLKAQAQILNAQTKQETSIAQQEAIVGKEARENLKLADDRAERNIDHNPEESLEAPRDQGLLETLSERAIEDDEGIANNPYVNDMGE